MTFLSEYQKLNLAQKQAVDNIEGPVMVVAGAGTGKTQTIALRIANILDKTQTPPSSILCLTFTDNAAFNMRSRLISIIGPSAYAIKIHTFHSFCNEVIQSRPEHFIFAKESRVIDQLEQIEIFQSAIDNLADGSVLKPWGNRYFYLREISSKIQSLKREDISLEKFEKLINEEKYFTEVSTTIFDQIKLLRVGKTLEANLLNYVDQILSIPQLSPSIRSLIVYHLTLYQKGGYVIGPAKNPAINFKNALLQLFDGYSKNIPKQQDLLIIYTSYQQALQDRGRYDFDDMILFVVRAFKDKPELLLEFQEKCQYILVDEYQDTNNSQDQIINLLGSYFDRPNIFVVGDDDQSIFRFQGASIENLQNFISRYQVEPIVLTNNYRSHQLILDSASSVINNNQNRLGNLIKSIDKNLISNSLLDPDPINLTVASSPLSENFLIISQIKKLLADGVVPSEIAVIYRNNHDVDELVEMLNHHQISFYLPADQNILNSRPIIHLINLLKLIVDPHNPVLLHSVLSSEFVNFDPLDLLLINQNKPISNKSQKKLKKFNLRLARARVRMERYNLDKFFNITIRKFKFLSYCLQSKNIGLLNQLHTFYNQLKRLCLEEKFSLAQFLARLDLYVANDIPLPCPPLATDLSSSIQLMTTHKAKGLEFGHVFIIQAVDKKWGNNPDRSTIKLPPGIINAELSVELNEANEEERRLFYVALTRAKAQIYISYSSRNNSNRDQVPSIFLSEINPKLIQLSPSIPFTQSEALQSFFPVSYSTKNLSPKLSSYLAEFFQNDYVFNVTHLNSYLRCPFCFYHTTILRIPQSKNKFSSFGTAIHATLSEYYLGKTNLAEIFENYLVHEQLPASEFNESLLKGKSLLADYIQKYPLVPSQRHLVDYDFRPSNIHWEDIPLTGKIDLINIIDGQDVEVVDFKTGNPDSKHKELSKDGDYFRQLVFYKLLSELDNNFQYKVIRASIDFVEKSKQKKSFVRQEFSISSEQLDQLKTEIKDVYQKIISQDFFHLGPDCRDPNHLHHLLKLDLS